MEPVEHVTAVAFKDGLKRSGLVRFRLFCLISKIPAFLGQGLFQFRHPFIYGVCQHLASWCLIALRIKTGRRPIFLCTGTLAVGI